MTTLKDLIKATQTGKPITLLHEKWLTSNHNPVYSPEALELARAVLSGEKGGARGRTLGLRASGTTTCGRKRLFDLNSYPAITDIDGLTANIFGTGNFLHLKWQMFGLTAGWLAEAEVPVENKKWGLSGTMDGIVYDNSIFEFKSINARGFQGVCTNGPKQAHVRQVHAYMLIAGMDKASVVYENKDSSDWMEFVVHRDETIVDEIKIELADLTQHNLQRTLPPMLTSCIEQTGYVYRGCPYRSLCPETEKLL